MNWKLILKSPRFVTFEPISATYKVLNDLQDCLTLQVKDLKEMTTSAGQGVGLGVSDSGQLSTYLQALVEVCLAISEVWSSFHLILFIETWTIGKSVVFSYYFYYSNLLSGEESLYKTRGNEMIIIILTFPNFGCKIWKNVCKYLVFSACKYQEIL